jgi:hypothetical protein
LVRLKFLWPLWVFATNTMGNNKRGTLSGTISAMTAFIDVTMICRYNN